MIYIVGWGFLYINFWLSAVYRHRKKVFVVLAVILLGGIAVLRGDVGNDTVMVYEPLVRSIQLGTVKWQGTEPLFYGLVKALTIIFASPRVVVRILSLLYTVLVLIYLLRSDVMEFYLLTFILPLFFSFGMNVLRVGLALSLFLLAFQYKRRRDYRLFAWLVVAAILMHYSIFIPLSLLWVADASLVIKRNHLIIFAIAVGFVFVVLFNQQYLISKLALYRSSTPPSLLSGLSKLIVGAICIVGITFSRLPLRRKQNLMITVTLAITASFVLVHYSYAGLRVLDLVVLATPLLVVQEYDRYNLQMDRYFRWTLFLGGLLMAAALYRNFLWDYGGRHTGTLSPFLPYRTIFEDGNIW